MISSAVYEKYGCLMVSPATVDSATERGFKYFFRPTVKASDNGKCAVNFAWHMSSEMGKKFKKVGVLHSDDAFGAAAGKTMEAEILKHPEWEMVGRIAYPAAKMVDATDYISRIKGQEIEVLFQSSTRNPGSSFSRRSNRSITTPWPTSTPTAPPIKKNTPIPWGRTPSTFIVPLSSSRTC